MQNRACQFMPFDSLKGFREALKEAETLTEDKKIISNELKESLDRELSNIRIGSKVLIKYYYEFEYIETIDVLKKIDKVYKRIILSNCIISIDDIISIKAL